MARTKFASILVFRERHGICSLEERLLCAAFARITSQRLSRTSAIVRNDMNYPMASRIHSPATSFMEKATTSVTGEHVLAGGLEYRL